MLLPVINVNISDTTDEELELALIEDVDQINRDELVESRNKGLELFVHALLNAPFRDETAFVSKSF